MLPIGLSADRPLARDDIADRGGASPRPTRPTRAVLGHPRCCMRQAFARRARFVGVRSRPDAARRRSIAPRIHVPPTRTRKPRRHPRHRGLLPAMVADDEGSTRDFAIPRAVPDPARGASLRAHYRSRPRSWGRSSDRSSQLFTHHGTRTFSYIIPHSSRIMLSGTRIAVATIPLSGVATTVSRARR